MFSQFFFLIAALFMISLAPVEEVGTFPFTLWQKIASLAALYLVILAVASLIKRKYALWLTQGLMIFYLWLAYYQIGIQTIIPTETFSAALSLMLFFFAIWRASKNFETLSMEIPMVLPFLLMTLFSDLAQVLSLSSLIVLSLGSLVAMLLFFPAFLVAFWQCTPLPSSALRDALESLCEKAKFKMKGFYLWHPLKRNLTAALLGVLPQCRYILLTESLLHRLSFDSVLAVCTHEIGHSKRGHLLYYPFILSGMLVSPLFLYLICENSEMVLILSLASMAIYFRFVFGYFSRLFEREADLYVFETDVPCDHLIQALDRVGIETGNSHLHPSWHHFSLDQRIKFLEKAKIDPTLINIHRKKVKRSMVGYFIAWIVALGVLWILFLNPII